MTPLPGISGSLLPGRYLADGFDARVRELMPDVSLNGQQARLQSWWRHAAATCGPATGLRTLFDVVAMPLVALLGFRARAAAFEAGTVHVRLETRRKTAVSLVLLPWARRPAARWRDLVDTARAIGADWSFLLAPPFLSLVDARGRATRRSLDFLLPDAFDDRSVDRFWLLACADAFDTASAVPASRLDQVVAHALTFQARVRADLQRGVVEALAALGSVLRRDRADNAPRDFEEALTLIYRMLFLLFAESRDLVPRHHPVYGRSYAVESLCRDALADRAAAVGLWDGLAAITRLSRSGCHADDLIVRPFNGRLFARAAAPSLESGRRHVRPTRETLIRDAALSRALVALGTRPGRAGREEIAYADLGVEQLGAVYERVLDLDPETVVRATHASPIPSMPAPVVGARRASLGHHHSLQRKQTGTFYTPQSLAEFVVRRALAPLVRGTSSDAILALRVVDPAMGSGAFLVAACQHLASAYGRALVEEGRCAETDLDDRAHASHKRLVAERCLAGVDLNPVAVQLARLSMWLTTLSRGKPLSFLDHRLRVGNSLVGAAPEDLWRVSDARASSSTHTLPLFDALELEHMMRETTRPLMELARRPDDTAADVRAKESAWRQLIDDHSPLAPWRLACSLWCARFFWPEPDATDATTRPSSPELRAALDAIVRHDQTLAGVHVRQWIATSRAISARHAFFHWPLEFADVFYNERGVARDNAGFDAVIGNPPWEMLRRESADAADREHPATAARGRHLVRFIRDSGLYPSCDRGHVNLYQPFLERALSITKPGGRVGLILPWGLATDDGAAALRGRLLDRCHLDTVVGLDNAAALFPIHRGLRFAVVTARVAAGESGESIRARFGVRTAQEIEAIPDADEPGAQDSSAMSLTRDAISAIGGPTRRIPDIRRPSDLEWLWRLSQQYPRLGASDGWQARFGRELNATEDRPSFGARGLPVIDGKHITPFGVDAVSMPWRITPDEAARLLPDRRFERARLGYRDVSGFSNQLSLIAAVVPAGLVTTHTIFCLRSAVTLEQQHFLCGLFNSYVLNAIVRMLMGSHVTTSLVEALPVPTWTGSHDERRVSRLAARLAAHPDSTRVRATLHASVAELYQIDVQTFAAILESFPLVARPEREAARRALERRCTPHPLRTGSSIRPSDLSGSRVPIR